MKTRKEFITASMVAASVGALMIPSGGEAPAQGLPDFSFDENAFNQTLARAAKHRHLFAATTIAGGSILQAMNNTLYAYNHSLNVPDGDVFQVGVLYHGASLLQALGDSAWTQLILPALPRLDPKLRSDVQTLHISSGNPMRSSIQGLVSRGCAFFVCNNALNGLSMQIAQALGRSPNDVYSQFSSGLVQGATRVPAGVWAVHAIQEARFTYLQTSL